MRLLLTCTALSLTLTGSAFAFGGCGPAGCGPDSDCPGGCTAEVSKKDIKKTCYNVMLKKICVPPTRFPWDPSPCDSLCGDDGACGAAGGPAAPCGAAGQCGAGECGAGHCKDGGLVSRLRDLLGMSNRGVCRTIKYPDKDGVKVGETCVCKWKCDDESDPNVSRSGCAPSAAPAVEEQAPAAQPPAEGSAPVAPPETAGRFLLRVLR